MSERSLTDKPVARTIARLSAPMTVGVLSIMLVGLADSFFLGQVGEAELAAVGFVYPVMIALTSLGIGMSAGANSVISRALGAGQGSDAARLSAHALFYAVSVGLMLSAILFLVHRPLLALIGARGATLDAAAAYFQWWIAGFPFLLAAMTAGAVMRSRGYAIWPATLMCLQSVINIGLTPLFVFGAEGILTGYGAAGAGFATFAARAIESVVALIVVLWVVGAINRSCLTFAGSVASVRQITKVAAPAAATNAINPAGMAVVTAAVATLGDAAVAGFGVATRIQSFALVPLLALSGGIGPFVGQNWGAEKHGRVNSGLSVAWGFAVLYGLAMAAVLYAFAEPILGVFSPAEDALKAGALYLRIVGWSLFAYGVLVISNAALNARGRPSLGLAASLIRVGCVFVPGAWLGAYYGDYTGILAAAVAANLAGLYLAVAGTIRAGLFDITRYADRYAALAHK